MAEARRQGRLVVSGGGQGGFKELQSAADRSA